MNAAEAAACYYARQNDFFPAASEDSLGSAGCVATNDPEGATLEVHYPPDGRAGQYQGHAGFVQVVISREQETFFGKVIGQAFVTVTSDAVAARQRGETNTHSLVALDPVSCVSAEVHGNGTITIFPTPGYTGPGGYVQVNSSCGTSTSDDDYTNGTGALKIAGTADLTAPKVNVNGSCQSNADEPHGTLDEAASQIGDPLGGLLPPSFNPALDGASCGIGGLPLKPTGQFSAGCSGSGSGRQWAYVPPAQEATMCPGLPGGYACVHLYPGVYFGGWNIGTKLRVVLHPGIYIIAGGGVKIGATGSLDSVIATGSGPAPVLIFNTDNPNYNCPSGTATQCQGDLDLTAGGSLKLAGLVGNLPCPPVTTVGGCPYGGMLIWFDEDGSRGINGLVDLQGGAILEISGTIYAPKATVDIHGNVDTNCGSSSTQVAAVQIISWQWKLGGTGDLCMPYDPTKLYKLNQQGLVH